MLNRESRARYSRVLFAVLLVVAVGIGFFLGVRVVEQFRHNRPHEDTFHKKLAETKALPESTETEESLPKQKEQTENAAQSTLQNSGGEADDPDLKKKVGQLFMFGFRGSTPSEHIRAMIQTNHLGGVILLKHNIRSIDQLVRLTASLQDISADNLLIAVDQEGGKINRLDAEIEIKTLPSPRKIAESGNPENAKLAGDVIGQQLAAVGINMNLAPVLDVNNNPNNVVIGSRSFGDDPALVAEFGAAFIQGIRPHVIATGKHFPGHGDTSVDSHNRLPIIKHNLDYLEEVDLTPFRKAINVGVDAIMIGHIAFPALDKSRKPATLSEIIVTKLLRNQLHFRGVIISDDMEMGAIVKHYGVEQASIMAISAGVDILIYCCTPERQQRAYRAVLEKASRDPIFRERVESAYRKIAALKSSRIMRRKLPYRQIIQRLGEVNQKAERLSMSLR